MEHKLVFNEGLMIILTIILISVYIYSCLLVNSSFLWGIGVFASSIMIYELFKDYIK